MSKWLWSYALGCPLIALDPKVLNWYMNKHGFLELDIIIAEGMKEY